MAILQANSSGVVSGHFTIPSNVPVGTKLVAFDGSGGSHGEARFIGSNTVVTTTMRQNVSQLAYDPLAQTFTLSADGQISGVDLWFTAKGDSDIIVHIREVSVGFPTQSVLAVGRLANSAVITNGSPTRVAFPNLPFLRGNTEYAIVVMCDDAITALAVAQLGKWDTANGRWITSQPYQVGVLLSSSNASTWTAHQDMDLTFRLLSPSFASNTRTIDIGTATATNVSDLMVMADAEVPSTGCSVSFRLTLIDNANEQITVAAYQPVSLAARYTGSVKVEAILVGTQKATPVLFPEVQLALGNLQETATYVTREFSANSGTALVVTLDAVTPGSSTLAIEVYNGTSWSSVAFDSATPIGDQWVERTYKKTGFSGTNARLRITMTGNAAARPVISNLRAILT